MKLNGNTSKRSAAAKREAADFAAQERSAHRSASARSAQSEAAARRAAAPKQTAQRQPVSRQADPAQGTPQPKARNPAAAAVRSPCALHSSCWPSSSRPAPSAWCSWRKKDSIFPNVSVCGTDVGGMTQSEAADAIRAAGWDDTSAPVLTMTFPGDRTITVTATEIGFEATPDAAAEAAYAYGRSGNAFTNFFTWLRCALKGARCGG